MRYLAEYWYFHIPNYIVAALIYTLLARFVMGLFVPREWPFFIWQFFCRITDPVLRATRLITPSLVVEPLLPLVAIFWLFLLRFLYWLVLYRAGLAPVIEVAP